MFGGHAMLENSARSHESIVVQQPTDTKQLFLLFHGVGGSPEAMLHLAKTLAIEFPLSMIVSVAAPHACDLGAGYQWFSVMGITEENRPKRVQQALPLFVQEILRWQAIAAIDAAQTALIGFSQGAIMALEASALNTFFASRIVAHSGRFAQLPAQVNEESALHLIHGMDDAVMSCRHATEAMQKLQSIGADATVDVVPHLGHGMNQESIQLMLQQLKSM